MRADHARPLDPQDVGKQVLAHIEGQVLDRSAIAERHPWAVHVGGGIDIAAAGAEALDQFLCANFTSTIAALSDGGAVITVMGMSFVQRIRVST
jgi:hypothetical protein